MRHQIIFLEGLPGSGKTVYSKRLRDDLRQNHPIKQFEEGELNPIDLEYISVMSHAEYQTLLTRFKTIKAEIEAASMRLKDYIITAFTKVRRPSFDDPFYEAFSAHQLTEKADFETFKQTYYALWEAFAKQHDGQTLYIYGGAFLQNHYEALWLKYGLNEQEMRQYFIGFIATLQPLNPLVVYLKQTNLKATISRVANQRKASQTGAFKDWFDLVKASLSAMPLSESKGYLGEAGAYRFYHDEQTFETELLPSLQAATLQLDLNDDYEKPHQTLLTHLNQTTKSPRLNS